jgi:hypothetical protein
MTGIDCFVPIEDPTLKLEGILAMNLHDHSSDVEEVTDRALKEANMEDSLEKLTHTWKDPGRIFWIVEKFKVRLVRWHTCARKLFDVAACRRRDHGMTASTPSG